MVTLTFDTTQIARTVLGNDEAVAKAGLFGAIMVDGNGQAMPHFVTAYETMQLNTISWPGGTIAESGYFMAGTPDPRPLLPDGPIPPGGVRAFDIDYPDLLHPDLLAGGGRAGLTDIMAYAVASHSALSIKIPSNSYFEGEPAHPEDIGHAYRDFKALLIRIYSPDGDLHGQAPPDMIFELGNERYDNPGTNYGPIAVAYCMAAREIRALYPDADFKLALQAMQTPDGSLELIGAFENPPPPPPPIPGQPGPGPGPGAIPDDLLSEIDIIRHHDLGHDVGQSAPMEDVTGQEMDSIRPFFDAIARAGGDPDAVELFCSAFSSASCDFPKSFFTGNPQDTGNDIPFSLVSAAALAALLTSLVEEGVDYGAIWGINTDEFTTTALTAGGTKPIYSPLGEAYRMMSESLQGCKLVANEALDFTRKTTDVFRYTYVDDSKAVIIVAADDLPANHETVTINLVGFGPIGSVWIERLTASHGSYGTPIITREALEVNGNTITFTLNSDFEFTRLIVARENPGEGKLLLWGGETGEVLRGGTSQDRIDGNAGGDTLWGRGGDDTMTGGNGDDHVSLGRGKDWADGQDGFDTLDLSSGQNRQVLDLREHEQSGLNLKGEWIFNFEAAIGGRGNDALLGDLHGNAFFGGLGDDYLFGRRGSDTVTGGMGDDVLSGGRGDDLLIGDAGHDHFVFSAQAGSDTIADINTAQDSLRFTATSPMDTRTEVINHAVQDGADVVIHTGPNSGIRILGMDLADMQTIGMEFL